MPVTKLYVINSRFYNENICYIGIGKRRPLNEIYKGLTTLFTPPIKGIIWV